MKTFFLFFLSLSLSQDLHALDLGKYLKKLIGVEEESAGTSSEKETNDSADVAGSCWEEEIKSAGPITGMPRGSSGKRIICGPTFYGLWAMDEVVDEEILTEEQMLAELGIARRPAPVEEGSETSKYQRHHIRFPKREYSDDPWHTTYVKISGPTMRCGTFLDHTRERGSFRFELFPSAHAQSSSNRQGPLTEEELRNLAWHLRETSEDIRQDLLGRLTGWGDTSAGSAPLEPGTEAWSYHEDTADTLDWLCHEMDPASCPCPAHLSGLCSQTDLLGGLSISWTDSATAPDGPWDGSFDGLSEGIRLDYRLDSERLPDLLGTLVHEGSHALGDWFNRGVGLPADLNTYQNESTAFIVESIFHNGLDSGPYSSAFERDALSTYRDLMEGGGDLARLSVMLDHRDGYFRHVPAIDRTRHLNGLERAYRDMGGFDGMAGVSRAGLLAQAGTNAATESLPSAMQDRNQALSHAGLHLRALSSSCRRGDPGCECDGFGCFRLRETSDPADEPASATFSCQQGDEGCVCDEFGCSTRQGAVDGLFPTCSEGVPGCVCDPFGFCQWEQKRGQACWRWEPGCRHDAFGWHRERTPSPGIGNRDPIPRRAVPRQIGHRENLHGYDDPDRSNVMPREVATNTPSDDMGQLDIDGWCWNQMPNPQGGPCEENEHTNLADDCDGLRGTAGERCRGELPAYRREQEQLRREGRAEREQREAERRSEAGPCPYERQYCHLSCDGRGRECSWVSTAPSERPTCLREAVIGGTVECVRWSDKPGGGGDDGDGGGGGGGSDRPPPPEEADGGGGDGGSGGDSGGCTGLCVEYQYY